MRKTREGGRLQTAQEFPSPDSVRTADSCSGPGFSRIPRDVSEGAPMSPANAPSVRMAPRRRPSES